MDNTAKTEKIIKDYFDAFSKLSAEEKVYFLAAIDKELAKVKAEDKPIFLYLIRSAREGKTVQQALDGFKKGK